MNNFLRSVIAFFRMLFTGKFPQKSHISYKSDFEEVKHRIAADQQKRNYTAVRPHKDGPSQDYIPVRGPLSSRQNTIREHRLVSQYSKQALVAAPVTPYESTPAMFEPPFQVGDVVEWGSQSKGTFAYKQGVIIAVVPEGVEKWDVLKMHGLISEEYGLDRIGKGGKRNHPSFLVEVEGVTGQKKIYHPRVADLSFPK